MSGVTIRDTSHTWNVRNVVGVTLLSHIPPQPPHSISSTRTTPWIIQGVVREKYSGSSRVLLSKRMARTSLSQSSLGTQEIPAGLPTPTIDKVSFCFVNCRPTYLFSTKIIVNHFRFSSSVLIFLEDASHHFTINDDTLDHPGCCSIVQSTFSSKRMARTSVSQS